MWRGTGPPLGLGSILTMELRGQTPATGARTVWGTQPTRCSAGDRRRGQTRDNVMLCSINNSISGHLGWMGSLPSPLAATPATRLRPMVTTPAETRASTTRWTWATRAGRPGGRGSGRTAPRTPTRETHTVRFIKKWRIASTSSSREKWFTCLFLWYNGSCYH